MIEGEKWRVTGGQGERGSLGGPAERGPVGKANS